MKINIERAAGFCICTVCAFLALFLLVRYFLPIVLPFAPAFLLALATKNLADKLHKKTGIPTPLLRVLILLFLILLVFSLLFFLGFCLVKEAEALLFRFGDGSDFENAIASLRASFHAFASHLKTGGVLEEGFDLLLREGADFVFFLLSSMIKNAFFVVPRALAFLLIMLIAALYFAFDLHRVCRFCTELVPRAYKREVKHFILTLKSCLLRYLRAYGILSGATFFVLLIAFLCMGIHYAVLCAILITLLDFLPVFGVGCALVPWGIFLIAAGEGGRGFGLLLLFVLMFGARQILEPKIVGSQIGLHPLASLFFTYAGLRFFGIGGMIFLPIAAAVAYEFLRAKNQRRE